jgi:hypothetical protein
MDDKPNQWAVLIGIDDYNGPEARAAPKPSLDHQRDKAKPMSSLRGCVSDVLVIEQYLLNTIKVEPGHITKLLAPIPGHKYPPELQEGSYNEPTYENIVNALDVPENSKSGDFVYIHYSGHGARTPTAFATLKSQGLDGTAIDEVLVPSDIMRGGECLRDLELGILLDAMASAGLVVTMVLDCCHSGGATRGDDAPHLGETRRVSDIQRSEAVLACPKNMARILELGTKLSWMQAQQGFVVLAACEEEQLAREIVLQDRHHGLLTHSLMSILRDSPVGLSSQALYERIWAKVQDHNRAQRPLLIGDRDRFFFSKDVRSRVYALSVRRAAVTYRDIEDRSVDLSGGQLHDVVVGSEYNLLPSSFDLRNKIEESDVLARVRVEKVGLGESIAFFQNTDKVRWDQIEVGCHAVLHTLPLEKQSTVCVSNLDEEAKRQLLSYNRTCLNFDCSGGRTPSFTIDIDEARNFQICDTGGNFTDALRYGAFRSLPACSIDSLPVLFRRLEHLHRYKMIKELVNPGVRPGTPPTLVTVEVATAPKEVEHGEHIIKPADIKLRGGEYSVEEMTALRIKIKNVSGRLLGCVVLDCGAEFSIEQLQPSGKPYETIPVGEVREWTFWFVVPSELEMLAKKTLPIVDTLKIFACNPPKNLDTLQLPGLKDMEDIWRGAPGEEVPSSLDDFLDELEASRKGFSAPTTAKKGADWETVNLRIQVRPKPDLET